MKLSELKTEIIKQSKRILKAKVPTSQTTLTEVEDNLIELFNNLSTQARNLLDRQITEQQIKTLF